MVLWTGGIGLLGVCGEGLAGSLTVFPTLNAA